MPGDARPDGGVAAILPPAPMEDLLPTSWRDYRNRRTAVLAAIGAWLPMHWAGMSLARFAASRVPHLLLDAGWATGCVAAIAWFLAFRCPWCGAHFHWTVWVGNPFAGTCLHCGFRKWKDPEGARRLRPPGGRR